MPERARWFPGSARLTTPRTAPTRRICWPPPICGSTGHGGAEGRGVSGFGGRAGSGGYRIARGRDGRVAWRLRRPPELDTLVRKHHIVDLPDQLLFFLLHRCEVVVLAVMHGPRDQGEVVRRQVSFKTNLEMELLGRHLHIPHKQIARPHLLLGIHLDEVNFFDGNSDLGVVLEAKAVANRLDERMVFSV